MSDFFAFFSSYFQLGLRHILDPAGYDHILYVAALVATQSLQNWRKVLVLVTAFTLGHSLTLALATTGWVQVESTWVEAAIPLTILLTCLLNIRQIRDQTAPQPFWYSYALAGVFGLVHGLGFSGYLRSLLGEEQSLVGPLFAFNCGLEAGQLVIVGLMLGFSALLASVEERLRKGWALLVLVVTGLMALQLLVERV